MIGHVEISFIEREWFDERREPEQDLADDSSLFPVNIEAGRKNDEVRAALERHEGRHGRAHAELARFVVAGRQDPAPVSRAAHADRLAFQRWLVAHFDRRVKAIHVEMDDGARSVAGSHENNLLQGAALSKPGRDAFPKRPTYSDSGRLTK